MFRAVVLFVLVAAGCYNPTFKNDIACDPTGACPAGSTCAVDGKCHAHGVDAIDASTGGLDTDAPTVIDAPPVGCSADVDCQTPPDLCSTAGTCNTSKHQCVFTPKDCSASNDDCNLGTCEATTGQCIQAPAHSGQSCGAGLVCGAFGSCGELDPNNDCATHGKVARACTSHTCHAGACVAAAFTDKQDCTMSTDQNPCGSRTPALSGCSGCNYGAICNQTAPPQACTCTTTVCVNESCSGHVAVDCHPTCPDINTDGTVCQMCDTSFTERICSGGTCSAAESCGNQ